MKKYVILLLTLASAVAVQAQVARWVLHPRYDEIRAFGNSMYLVYNEGKCGLVDNQENELLPTQYDRIEAFRNGYAVVMNTQTNKMVGYTDGNGNLANMESEGYQIVNGYPYFSCGYLLVEKEGSYYFINGKTRDVIGPYAEAYPFFDNIACVKKYEDPGKKKGNLYYAYIDARTGMDYAADSGWENSDINFLSSASNGKAIMVYKKKFYSLNVAAQKTTPLYVDSTMSKKAQITAPSKDITPIIDNENQVVMAKNGEFVFDPLRRLVSSRYADQEPVKYSIARYTEPIASTHISVFAGEDNLLGLNYNGELLLPAQFTYVKPINKPEEAIVKVKGKCGVIIVEANRNFEFELKDKDKEESSKAIGFQHDTKIARLTLRMPSTIKSSETTIRSKSADCKIPESERDTRDNLRVNSVWYNCELKIPQNIQMTEQDFTYTVAVNYEGIRSKDYDITVKEWYIQNYQFEITNKESKDSTLFVEFRIDNPESKTYLKEVKCATEPEYDCRWTPISEGNFRCEIPYGAYKKLNFIVRLKEGQCPELQWQEEIQYPEPKSRPVVEKAPVARPKPQPTTQPKPKPKPKPIIY